MPKHTVDYNITDSILVVKASNNVDIEANKDLNLPEGKSIADLLNDEKNISEKTENQEENSQDSNKEVQPE